MQRYRNGSSSWSSFVSMHVLVMQFWVWWSSCVHVLVMQFWVWWSSCVHVLVMQFLVWWSSCITSAAGGLRRWLLLTCRFCWRSVGSCRVASAANYRRWPREQVCRGWRPIYREEAAYTRFHTSPLSTPHASTQSTTCLHPVMKIKWKSKSLFQSTGLLLIQWSILKLHDK